MPGPLSGIKVIDLTRVSIAPGPWCTMLMSDLGADVLLVEQPALQESQTSSTDATNEARRKAGYETLGRNKRSIALNLKYPKAQEILRTLCQDADVFLEGFRPGVVQRLGCDYSTISELNPRIVYCSISGYGQDGPYRGLVGHDINYISTGGALSLVGQPGGPPVLPQNLIGDFAGGSLHAAVGILAALIARQETGRGQYIDISMTDCTTYLLASMIGNYSYDGVVPRGGETLVSGTTPFYNTYECEDGKYIGLGCIEPHFWEPLCRGLGREDFIPHQHNEAMYPEIFATFRRLFKSKSRDEWFDILFNVGNVAVSKVYGLDEVLRDPHMQARDMAVEVETLNGERVLQVGIGPKFSDTPGRVRSVAPVIGQETDQVLESLGYSVAETAQMRDQGAVG